MNLLSYAVLFKAISAASCVGCISSTVSMISIGWTDMSCRNLREGDAAAQMNVETKFEHDRERTVSMILEPSPMQNEDRVTD